MRLSKNNMARLLYAAIILGGILLDQLTKHLAVKYLMPIGSYPLIKGVFHLTYLENPGAAFGILKDHPWVFQIFSAVAIFALGIYLFIGRSYLDDKREDGSVPPIPITVGISLAMIISGGIGNMIDRLMYGYVVDFLDFTLIDFAIFNVADSFVTVACFWLVFQLLFGAVKEWKKKKNEEQ